MPDRRHAKHQCWYCRHRGFPKEHHYPDTVVSLAQALEEGADHWEPGELRCPPCQERIRAEEGNEGSAIPF